MDMDMDAALRNSSSYGR